MASFPYVWGRIRKRKMFNKSNCGTRQSPWVETVSELKQGRSHGESEGTNFAWGFSHCARFPPCGLPLFQLRYRFNSGTLPCTFNPCRLPCGRNPISYGGTIMSAVIFFYFMHSLPIKKGLNVEENSQILSCFMTFDIAYYCHVVDNK